MPVRPADSYPFAAIVGQDTLKTALLLNAVDPRISGVLVRGHKGTAKSTAVRALAAVLPDIDVVEGCRYSCDPNDPGSWCDGCRERREEGPLPAAKRRPRVVDLPVSATEDRVVGSIDLERALKHGERSYDPGILADANRGILYVDEVNLLDDHLVDTLLDAAAMGVNVVEREGIQCAHPARFMLVGTMNPEEGEVRPQLLDRFGLCVDVEGIADPDSRVEIVRRRQSFEEDPVAFNRVWGDTQAELATVLRHARVRLSAVETPDDVLHLVANVCAGMGVDGHRADIVMTRAAAAHAALNGRTAATGDDVRSVAPMVLAHRTRRQPFEDRKLDEEALSSLLGAAADSASPPSPEAERERGEGDDRLRVAAFEGTEAEQAVPVDAGARVVAPIDQQRRSNAGRRQETLAGDRRGRYARSEPLSAGSAPDVAIDATIRAAAPHQRDRERQGVAVAVEPSDLRTKVRKRRVGASLLFCVDASGSMGAANRMETAKSAVLDLLVDAYQRRDRVGLVAFRGDAAEVILPPTASVEIARLRLRDVKTGGATPLAAGILRSLELLQAEMRRNPEVVPWLILVTDGKANVGVNGGLGSEDARAAAARVRATSVNTLIVDTNPASTTGTAARELARAAGADYVRLQTFDASSVAGAVRLRMESP